MVNLGDSPFHEMTIMRLDHGTWQICSEVRWYLALLWRLGTARQCGPRLTDHGTFFLKVGRMGWNTSISLPKWKDQGQVTRVFESLQGDQLAITLRFPPRLWCLHLGPVWCTPQRTCRAEHEPSRAGMRNINGPCKVRHILVLLSVLLGWRPFGLCSDQRKPVDSPGWLCKIHPLCNSTSARNTWEHSPKRCSLHGPLLLCRCKASTLQFFWV
jgi:hypothetical protein